MATIRNLVSRIAVCLLFGHWLAFIYLAQLFTYLAHAVENFVGYCAAISTNKQKSELDRVKEDLEKLL
jgi:hypothetical protein